MTRHGTEQMDDDGRLPTLLRPFHPYQYQLPATIQKLRDKAEDPSDMPGNKHLSPPQAPCVPSPTLLRTGSTSTPSRFIVQKTCIMLIKQRNEYSQLMEITQLHHKQGAVHFVVLILIPLHYQQVLTFHYNILNTEMQLYKLLGHWLHGGKKADITTPDFGYYQEKSRQLSQVPSKCHLKLHAL